MSEDALIFAVKAVFAGAAVVAMVWFVLRPLWKMLRTGPDPSLFERTYTEPEELEGEELEIPVDGQARKPDRATLLETARKDPRLTANTVSRWLREKR